MSDIKFETLPVLRRPGKDLVFLISGNPPQRLRTRDF